MADSAVQITPGAGVNIDTRTQTNGDHRQVIAIGDPTSAEVAPVSSTNGVSVHVKASDVEQNLEIKNLGGNSIYSNAQGDFTAVFTNGTKELVLSAFANADLQSSLSVKNLVNGNVKKINSEGVVVDIPLTNISLNTLTFTLEDAPENFVTGDIAVVTLIGPDKGYNNATNLFEFTNLEPVAGEDTDEDVLGTMFKPVASATYSPTAGDNTYSSRVTKKNEKASAGNVYSVQVFNFGSSLAYFQLHNKATAPASGETQMTGCSWPVPAGTPTSPGVLSLTHEDFAPSQRHSTGIAWALSSTLNTFTDTLTATDFVVNLRRI